MPEFIHTDNVGIVVNLIERLKDGAPRAVSIWGPSGSGKTYLARQVGSQVAGSRTLSVDDYLSEEVIAGPRYPIEEYIQCIEGVNPNIWDQSRLNNDLLLALSGRALSVPRFDTKNRARLPDERTVEAAEITIVEGAYSYENSIQHDLSALVVVASSLHSRFVRKLARTINKTGRTDIDESIQRYMRQTQGSLAFTWQRHLNNADLVFHNDPLPDPSGFSGIRQNETRRLSDSAVSLTPTGGYGRMNEGELLAVDTDRDNRLRLVYRIGDATILDHQISHASYQDIRVYYDEN